MSEIGEASGAGGVALSAAGALSRLHAERLAKNVPLSASELYNPALTPSSVLGRFLESWPSIFVLCYKETCDAHRHSGAADGRRVWWQSIQPRLVVFDGAEVDARHADAVRWAGCDLPDAPAGRSGAPPTREPCTFAQPSGGADWRRTSKHRLLATLAHLALVEEAERRNLSRVRSSSLGASGWPVHHRRCAPRPQVLILEADAVPSLANEELSLEPSRAAALGARLSAAFASRHPWSVLRLSGMFYSREFARPLSPQARRGGRRRSCSPQCQCTPWAGLAATEAATSSYPLACEVAPDPNPSDTVLPMLERLGRWCDVRDTSAYAVHRRAYPAFTSYLRRLLVRPAWLRDAANNAPPIDVWLPHALPSVYLLPTLVSQPSFANDSQGATALMRQTSARQFMRLCSGGGGGSGVDAAPEGGGRQRRKMKLSAFATRHIYLLSDREVAAAA